MSDVDWWQYEAMLAIRGERAGVRLVYLEGQLEIMSPSRTHETKAKTIARLLEAYADETGVVIEGYKSMTLRSSLGRRGVEPDECYAVGGAKESPDLAIEIIWTHGGLDKLEVYRKLGVREVWIWEEGRLKLNALRGERYVEISGSELLPALDVRLLERCGTYATQTEAVRVFRAALRGEKA